MRMIPPGRRLFARRPDGADDSSTDPRGTETGCHTDLFVNDVADSVAVDELDPIGNSEFFSAEFRLPGEQLAHVDADADDSVIACPGAQHLARTAAEVEHTSPRFQAQCCAECGEIFWCERVMDAVSTFGDVEDTWDVQCTTSFY